jgi:flagellar hook-associated protein 1
MLGLFGTLQMGTRSLAAQRQGVEVAGHNLANVNNPAYARQRVTIQSSAQINSVNGPVGNGVDAVAIQQIRNDLVDQQLIGETSVGGSLEAQQRALQYAQANLGQQIDRLASGDSGAAAAAGIGGANQIAAGLGDVFNAFQSLSNNPTSLADREVVLMRASSLASQFQQVDARLGNLQNQLNESVTDDVAATNSLLEDIADINERILAAEGGSLGAANDLRDQRQSKLEDLAKLVRFDSSEGIGGVVNISIGGVAMVTASQVTDRLDTYDAGGGRLLVRGSLSGTQIEPTGGSLHGTLEVRDRTLGDLRTQLNDLAGTLITEVNALHASGFNLSGGAGNDFFTGTGAADIAVNTTLSRDPALLQASADASAPGNNRVALQLAQLGTQRLPALGGQTFSESYSRSVAALGTALNSVQQQLTDHGIVADMLQAQRDSFSGVSIDEEMTDLTRFQRAYQASAKLITTVDELLDTTINLKR